MSPLVSAWQLTADPHGLTRTLRGEAPHPGPRLTVGRVIATRYAPLPGLTGEHLNGRCCSGQAVTLTAGRRVFCCRSLLSPAPRINEPAVHHVFRFLSLLSVAIGATVGFERSSAAENSLQPGDRVCLVGNALGERMQHHNHFETLLHHRLAQHQLVVRNLCFPGDEPWVRLRSESFGTPDEHLARCKADVVLFFFGYNESFELDGLTGEELKAGIGAYADALTVLVNHTKAQQYNGESAPRVVLVSPIAFEDTGNPNLPAARPRNASLRAINDAMAAVGNQTGADYIDLFHPTLAMFADQPETLTIDGGHLNDAGYAMLAPILAHALSDQAEPAAGDLTRLRDAVADKNFHWFNSYRAVNGYSIYGTRGEAGYDGTYRNRDVMNRELEILREMTAIRDARVWAIAGGQSFDTPVDDSGTLPQIQPKTNVGGPDDPNAKRGKLGSLRYLSTDEQMETFELADGYRVNLFASEEMFPELANPNSMCFDAKGQLWVSVMPSYPHWRPKTPMNDKILVLSDTDGDGTADRCVTFADGLHQPTGFELGRGGAFVAEQHNILFLKDTDGDGTADHEERTLAGFDTADSHHGLAAFEWGPGGGLHFQEGTFKFSQIESPHGLTRLHEGGVWRFDPRTRQFGAHVSFAFANPWGYAFDDHGQDFIGDASPGWAYWAAPISGRIDYPLKHPGGSQYRRVAKDYDYDNADVSVPLLYPKRIRPLAGCLFLKSEHFADDIQNRFLVTNVIGDRAILTHRIEDKDSGFIGTEEPMLLGGGDGNFRPVDLDLAPDGSLYVIDWHNALIGHLQHNLRDPSRDHVHGRIWRVTHKDRPLVDAPVIADLPTKDLVAELISDRGQANGRHAYRIRRDLAGRDSDEVLVAVGEQLRGGSLSEHDRLEMLWLGQTHNRLNESLLSELLEAGDHRVRAAATRVLSYYMDRVAAPLKRLEELAIDKHPRVRLEAVRATTHAAGQPWVAGREDRIVRIALSVLDHPMDDYLEYALEEAMRRFEQVRAQRAAGPAGQFAPPRNIQTLVATPEATTSIGPVSIRQQHGDLRPKVDIAERLPLQLDLSPAAVAYQLRRLTTADLEDLAKQNGDSASAPIHAALIRRPNASSQGRAASLEVLSQIQNVDSTTVLMSMLRGSDSEGDVNAPLARMLIQMPAEQLQSHAESLVKLAGSSNVGLAESAMAALMAGSMADRAWALATDEASTIALLGAIPRVPQADMRNDQRQRVTDRLDRSPAPRLQSAGLLALRSISKSMDDTFVRAAKGFSDGKVRPAAVAAMLRVPAAQIDPVLAGPLTEEIVRAAEATPKAKRTDDRFADLMLLADRLMPSLSIEKARGHRNRLRQIAVRLIRIRTIEEEMRYDVAHFAVQAGRPVQIVLENPDAMPHNLVITSPGKLKEVAFAGEATGPRGGLQNMAYVPKHPDVIAASGTAGVGERTVMTFDAPAEPGEYPFVCTFPQHWYRMYGVMVVAADLDTYLANPVEPADPIGNNRSLVRNWKVDDFPKSLDEQLRGRTASIGSSIFAEATCLGCHQIGGQGGRVGPALDKITEKYKGDAHAVLVHILEPSRTIEEKYKTRLILTRDGETLSGTVSKETDDVVELWAGTLAKEPTVIRRDDIEEMMTTDVSPMPKAIMDLYTEDEIYELLAYLVKR